MKIRIFIALAAAGLAFLAQTACSSSKAHELAATNSKNLKRMNEKLSDLRSALVDARDTMIEVQQQEGKKAKPFEDFTRKTAKLIPQIDWFTEQAEQLASNHAALIKEWDKSLEQIEIPALRAVAEDQKAKTFKTYQTLPGLAATLSTTLSGLKKEYTDLQKLYSLTLSEETLSATTTMVTLTATRSTEILSQIDKLMEQISIAVVDLDNASGQGEQKGHAVNTQTEKESSEEKPVAEETTPSENENSTEMERQDHKFLESDPLKAPNTKPESGDEPLLEAPPVEIEPLDANQPQAASPSPQLPSDVPTSEQEQPNF